MCTTKPSPADCTGPPSADTSIPELSIATWPRGLDSTRKISPGSAAIVRWTSNRSAVMPAFFHRSKQGCGAGGERLWERVELGHAGPHVVVEAAGQLQRAGVVGRVDEDG